MQPRISFITLGVTDLQRMAAFYHDGLGLPVRFQDEQVVFLELHGPQVLALFLREELAKDIGLPVAEVAPNTDFRGFALAHNVTSPEAVDAVLREAEAAGGTIIKPGGKVFWGGYTGYFADPEGFYWEVAYNPGMPEFAAEQAR